MSWIWLACRPNILGFSYMMGQVYMSLVSCRPNILVFNYALGPNRYGSSELLVPIFLGLATCHVQVHMSLTSYQTQHPRVQLCTEPKQICVWQATRPSIIRSSYMLSPSTHVFGELPDPIFWVQLRAEPKQICV